MSLLSSGLTLLLGALGGGVVGGFASWWISRRRVPFAEPHELSLDALQEQRIAQAAQQWAAAYDQPAAAPLVADKLRLAYNLNQRRQRRRNRGRWWR
jgi:hypothetical protein